MPCELADTDDAVVGLQGPLRAEVVLSCQICTPGRGQKRRHVIESSMLDSLDSTLEDSLLRPGARSK